MDFNGKIATLHKSQLSDLVKRSCTQPALLSKSLIAAIIGELTGGGIGGLISLIFRRSDRELRLLTEPNMKRRKIRWPWLYAGPILWFYGKIKRVQARIQLSYFNRVLRQINPDCVFIWNGYLMPFSLLRIAAEQQKLRCEVLPIV